MGEQGRRLSGLGPYWGASARQSHQQALPSPLSGDQGEHPGLSHPRYSPGVPGLSSLSCRCRTSPVRAAQGPSIERFFSKAAHMRSRAGTRGVSPAAARAAAHPPSDVKGAWPAPSRDRAEPIPGAMGAWDPEVAPWARGGAAGMAGAGAGAGAGARGGGAAAGVEARARDPPPAVRAQQPPPRHRRPAAQPSARRMDGAAGGAGPGDSAPTTEALFVALGAGVTALSHPLLYVKLLIQVAARPGGAALGAARGTAVAGGRPGEREEEKGRVGRGGRRGRARASGCKSRWGRGPTWGGCKKKGVRQGPGCRPGAIGALGKGRGGVGGPGAEGPRN